MSRPEGLISKQTSATVAATVAALQAEIVARGLTVFAVIDHSGEAHRHGLDLPDTQVVVFGSPVAGTPVMQAAPLIALDLPLKVLVFDDGGTTTLSYLAPDALVARYGLDPAMAGAFAGITVITDAVLH